MFCTQEFVDYIIEQLDNTGVLRAIAMFGG